MSDRKYYIVGTIKGPNRIAEIDAAAQWLRSLGYGVISPVEVVQADMGNVPIPELIGDKARRRIVGLLLHRFSIHATHLAIMPGWQMEFRCRNEVRVAFDLGIPRHIVFPPPSPSPPPHAMREAKDEELLGLLGSPEAGE